MVSTAETSGFHGGNRWFLLGKLPETIVIVEIIQPHKPNTCIAE
jgi:hypothetical protein